MNDKDFIVELAKFLKYLNIGKEDFKYLEDKLSIIKEDVRTAMSQPETEIHIANQVPQSIKINVDAESH